jgi:hypothetical protein
VENHGLFRFARKALQNAQLGRPKLRLKRGQPKQKPKSCMAKSYRCLKKLCLMQWSDMKKKYPRKNGAPAGKLFDLMFGKNCHIQHINPGGDDTGFGEMARYQTL